MKLGGGGDLSPMGGEIGHLETSRRSIQKLDQLLDKTGPSHYVSFKNLENQYSSNYSCSREPGNPGMNLALTKVNIFSEGC
jgi:hypothetical protein